MNIKHIKGLCGGIAVAMAICSQPVYALTIDEVDINIETGIMSVSGTTDADIPVILKISKADTSLTETESLVYMWQQNANEGLYDFEFSIKNAVDVNDKELVLTVTDFDGGMKTRNFSYYDSSVVSELREEINRYIGNTEKNIQNINALKGLIFENFENKKSVVASYIPFDKVYDDSLEDVFCELISYEKPFQSNEQLKKAVMRYSVITILGSSGADTSEYLKKYGKDLQVENSEAYKLYGLFNEDEKTAAASRLNTFERPFATVGYFTECYDTAMMITKLENVNGTDACKNVLSKFPQYFNSAKLTTDGCKKIMGEITEKNINTVTDITKILDEYSENQSAPMVPSGSGGGGGGGKSVAMFEPVVPSYTEKEAEAPITFADISEYEWAKESIGFLVSKGIINGKSDGIFAPGDNVTRAEICKMIYLALKLNTYDVKDSAFTDVSSKDWYYECVSTAYELGIVNGVSETEFEPHTFVSREDMAVMAYRALKVKNISFGDSSVAQFNDSVDISGYAEEAVAALKAEKLINGDENGNFNPKSFATRAEAAKFICEICRKGE